MSSVVAETKEKGRFFDRQRQLWIVRVAQGNYQISSDDDVVLHTILGSCIAACIRDPVLRIGGMNHFLLPHSDLAGDPRTDPLASRYGGYAMELLINGILSRGGQRSRLEVKLFGGGNVVKGISGVGHKNSDFIERFMKDEKLPITTMHLRRTSARRVEYSPSSGRARMMLITDESTNKIFKEETRHMVRADQSPGGDIELFD